MIEGCVNRSLYEFGFLKCGICNVKIVSKSMGIELECLKLRESLMSRFEMRERL